MIYNIASYDYYLNFKKVYENSEDVKIGLNILNSLIDDRKIKENFRNLIEKYPVILNVLPILIAKRENEINCWNGKENIKYFFQIKLIV